MRNWLPFTGERIGKRRAEAGIATVEMAVVLPLLLFMFVAVADFGRVFYTAITLAHAARAGAAYGVQSNAHSEDTTGISQAAKDEAKNIDKIGSPVTVTSLQFCRCPEAPSTNVNCTTKVCTTSNYTEPQVFVQVTASKTFNTLINYPGIPSSKNLTRTATLRVQ